MSTFPIPKTNERAAPEPPHLSRRELRGSKQAWQRKRTMLHPCTRQRISRLSTYRTDLPGGGQQKPNDYVKNKGSGEETSNVN